MDLRISHQTYKNDKLFLNEEYLSFEEYKEKVQDSADKMTDIMPFFTSFYLAGGILDYLITRKSVSQSNVGHRFTTYFKELKDVYKSYGVRELYRGNLTSLLGVWCLSWTSIFIQEKIRNHLNDNSDQEDTV